MFTLLKSLLPNNKDERVAQNHLSSKIKPRLEGSGRLKRFFFKSTLSGLLFLIFLGYFPIYVAGVSRQNKVLATDEKKYEVISDALVEALQLPHSGYVSTRFSSYHQGIDIATSFGNDIHPISSGVVEEVIASFLGFGNHVYVSHPGGLRSLYGHMGKIQVKKGQLVTQATILGQVGMTGHTSGPHTHLEIIKNGVYIDPLTILPKISDYPSLEIKETAKNLPPYKELQPDFN